MYQQDEVLIKDVIKVIKGKINKSFNNTAFLTLCQLTSFDKLDERNKLLSKLDNSKIENQVQGNTSIIEDKHFYEFLELEEGELTIKKAKLKKILRKKSFRIHPDRFSKYKNNNDVASKILFQLMNEINSGLTPLYKMIKKGKYQYNTNLEFSKKLYDFEEKKNDYFLYNPFVENLLDEGILTEDEVKLLLLFEYTCAPHYGVGYCRSRPLFSYLADLPLLMILESNKNRKECEDFIKSILKIQPIYDNLLNYFFEKTKDKNKLEKQSFDIYSLLECIESDFFHKKDNVKIIKNFLDTYFKKIETIIIAKKYKEDKKKYDVKFNKRESELRKKGQYYYNDILDHEINDLKAETEHDLKYNPRIEIINKNFPEEMNFLAISQDSTETHKVKKLLNFLNESPEEYKENNILARESISEEHKKNNIIVRESISKEKFSEILSSYTTSSTIKDMLMSCRGLSWTSSEIYNLNKLEDNLNSNDRITKKQITDALDNSSRFVSSKGFFSFLNRHRAKDIFKNGNGHRQCYNNTDRTMLKLHEEFKGKSARI